MCRVVSIDGERQFRRQHRAVRRTDPGATIDALTLDGQGNEVSVPSETKQRGILKPGFLKRRD